MIDPCSKMREKMAERLFGGLSSEEGRALDEHIRGCANCRAYALGLKDLSGAFEHLGRRLDAGMEARAGRVIDALESIGSDEAARRGFVWRGLLRSPVTRFAAAVIVIVVLLAAAKLLLKKGPKPGEAPTIVQKEDEEPGGGADERLLAQKVAAELKSIEEMFAASDIDGLVGMLESGEMESKIAAARYLGRIGDLRAIEALSRLAEQWEGDEGENPFKRAIEEIRARLERQETKPEPVEEQGQSEQLQGEFEAEGVLSGFISDVNTGEPIKGVKVEYITVEGWSETEEIVRLKREAEFVKHFELEYGGQINIRVVDEEGRPIKRAYFYAAYVSDDMGRGPKDSLGSDSEGVVFFGGLKAAEYWISAWHKDYAVAGKKVVIEEAREVKSVVFEMKKGIEIAGKAVCSDGLAAGGFGIEALPTWWHGSHSPLDHRISEEGTFLLPHIVPGRHRIRFSIPRDDGSRVVWSIDVNLPPVDGFLELDIPKPSLHKRVSISGTVEYVGGETGSGVWLHAHSDAGNR
ncbi:MAG: zf-HC2 domain-containing protein, partial [Planctomycetota bacterium]